MKTTTGAARYLFAACEAKTGDALAKLVLISLANRADNNGECYPSLSRIAGDCETSESSVKRKLIVLEALGLITRLNRTVDGMKTSNLYRIKDRSERPMDRSEGAEGRVTVTPGVRSERPIKHPVETPKETISKGRFAPPTVSEASDYFSERGADPAEAERFVDFYESKGWLVGKSKMKCWKSAVRNWIRRNQSEKPRNSTELARRNSQAVSGDFKGTDVSWIEKN
jgi:hypothetical protein